MTGDDDIARLRAEFDQSREAFKELGGNCWSLYSEAVSNGFDPMQALQLTIGIFTAILQKPSESGD